MFATKAPQPTKLDANIKIKLINSAEHKIYSPNNDVPKRLCNFTDCSI